ncbi:MAG: alpha/beta fold hydrolase [Streptosporangiales bacterium]|nr:alpha/beta fold hydrolase [Streptosporangiales bacterium]
MEPSPDLPDWVPEGKGGLPSLAYRDLGSRDADAVVLLHSLGTDQRLWSPQLAGLTESHRVVTVDSRGHGESGWTGSVTLADWTADLGRLLDHLELADAALVGLSMGGVQALAFAVAHPQRARSLVLADTFAELPPEVASAKIDAMTAQVQQLGMPGWADTYVAETFTEPLAEGAELVRSALARMSVLPYLAAVRACFGVRLGDQLGAVRVPTLVLWGDRDAKTPRGLSEQLVEGIPAAVLQEIPDAGHLANLENPKAFLDAVQEHLVATP